VDAFFKHNPFPSPFVDSDRFRTKCWCWLPGRQAILSYQIATMGPTPIAPVGRVEARQWAQQRACVLWLWAVVAWAKPSTLVQPSATSTRREQWGGRRRCYRPTAAAASRGRSPTCSSAHSPSSLSGGESETSWLPSPLSPQLLPSFPSCLLSRVPHLAAQVLRGHRISGQRRRRGVLSGESRSLLCSSRVMPMCAGHLFAVLTEWEKRAFDCSNNRAKISNCWLRFPSCSANVQTKDCFGICILCCLACVGRLLQDQVLPSFKAVSEQIQIGV